LSLKRKYEKVQEEKNKKIKLLEEIRKKEEEENKMKENVSASAKQLTYVSTPDVDDFIVILEE
jgi:hypothetical protein